MAGVYKKKVRKKGKERNRVFKNFWVGHCISWEGNFLLFVREERPWSVKNRVW